MIETILHKKIHEILIDLYGNNDYSIQFQSTRKEFEGDITLVVFPFTRFSKLSHLQESSFVPSKLPNK